jgi:hypothetical protein
MTICKILEGILPKESVRGAPPPDKRLLEYHFVFACVWAFGSCMLVDKVGVCAHTGAVECCRHLLSPALFSARRPVCVDAAPWGSQGLRGLPCTRPPPNTHALEVAGGVSVLCAGHRLQDAVQQVVGQRVEGGRVPGEGPGV